jgi:SAM-dependent methyltransferase
MARLSMFMKRLLRPAFLRLARSLGIFDIQTRMDYLTQRVEIYDIGGSSLDQLASRKATGAADIAIQTLWSSVVERDDAIQESVMNASRQHAETIVNEMRAHLEKEISQLRRNLDRLRESSIPEKINDISRQPAPSNAPTHSIVSDDLYVAIEDRFRGDPHEIGDRQSQYLPYIESVVTPEKPLLDLGCGRGEWLKLLRDNGIAAKGVDSNQICVNECAEQGLNTEYSDLESYLNSLPEGSLGAITMFQVLEHLPFDVLLKTLRLILRALTPGGIFIGEVPNSETLGVGATTFWIDPTHQRPLFPGLLTFLTEEIGFTKSEGIYSTPLKPEPDVTSLPVDIQEPFLSMFRQINGPGDFAVIATA